MTHGTLLAALLEATTADQVTVPRSALAPVLARLDALEARVVERDPDELLSLGAAALESGYSADYLGKLISGGRLKYAGNRHRPRVRRGDLPRKATALPSLRDFA